MCHVRQLTSCSSFGKGRQLGMFNSKILLTSCNRLSHCTSAIAWFQDTGSLKTDHSIAITSRVPPHIAIFTESTSMYCLGLSMKVDVQGQSFDFVLISTSRVQENSQLARCLPNLMYTQCKIHSRTRELAILRSFSFLWTQRYNVWHDKSCYAWHVLHVHG